MERFILFEMKFNRASAYYAREYLGDSTDITLFEKNKIGGRSDVLKFSGIN